MKTEFKHNQMFERWTLETTVYRGRSIEMVYDPDEPNRVTSYVSSKLITQEHAPTHERAFNKAYKRAKEYVDAGADTIRKANNLMKDALRLAANKVQHNQL